MDHWPQWAACLTEDPELFFPAGTTGAALDQIERAKTVCRRCPVKQQCLQWALDHHQDHGVWGGLSEEERRNIRRLHRPHSRGAHATDPSDHLDLPAGAAPTWNQPATASEI